MRGWKAPSSDVIISLISLCYDISSSGPAVLIPRVGERTQSKSAGKESRRCHQYSA